MSLWDARTRAKQSGCKRWIFFLVIPVKIHLRVLRKRGWPISTNSAAADLVIGDERVRIERRWREAGAKTKIFVDDNGMTARDFQQWLMGKLGIPLLNFPKGNPTSGQTWPELSFRMLLRHIYRQQRFWGDIADKQPEGEQHACILQFLGTRRAHLQ